MATRRSTPPPLPSLPSRDLALAQAAASGDDGAMRAIVERLVGKVRATAYYLCGGRPEAEDLAQESLVQILRSIGSYRGDCTLEYWADRITARTTMHDIRKLRRRERLDAANRDPDPERGFLDDSADDRRIRQRMAVALESLSEERRLAMVMRHVQGYAVAEIAEMTGTLLNTVRDRLAKGRRELRQRVQDDPVLRDWAQSEVEP